MKQLISIGLLIFLTVILIPFQTQAAAKLALAGAYLSTTPNVSSNIPGLTLAGEAEASYGGGALVLFPIGAMFEFQTGALYVQRKGGANATGVSTAETINTFTDLQIPALLRWNAGQVVSLGAGIVYNMGTGNVNTDTTSGGVTTSTSQSYSDAKFASSDTAAEASLQLRFGSGKGHFFIDANYQMGLADIDTSGLTPTKVNVMEALAGYMFEL